MGCGTDAGVLITVPLIYRGSRLEVNARAHSGGSIRAQFLNAAGRSLESASLSTPCTGESLRSQASWARNQGIVDRFKGEPASIRFHLRRAEPYSFAFRS